MRLVIGISGASGAIYGVRALEALKQLDIETHVVITSAATRTILHETSYSLGQVESLASRIYNRRDIGAAIASGSFKVDGMIIAPCSIKTLSAIAHSFNEDLLTRAADVQLKERRKLVLLVRETPLNLSHLHNMTAVTQMGGIILPPMPAFYHHPQTIDDIVNQTVGKALDQFGIDAELFERWKGM
jgi:4-hydroxy-3-polyprenylbenzoate decarboxylase